jgi:exopolyphosphatase / guanosine-5'-triphosphate,3'-diphosphate pyrophosphatase
MPPRCACIDVGANTTRLLVADVPPGQAPRTVHNEHVSLSLRPRADGNLGPAMGRALAGVVQRQLEAARDHGAVAVRIVATGPLRAARDRDHVLEGLGAPVEVLTGEEEARLAFAGATAGLRLDGAVGVVDAGGASTELAVGTCAGGAAWTASVPVGSGVLLRAHVDADPPEPDELDALMRAARRAFQGLLPPRPQHVLAVGGAAGSLKALCGEVLDEPALDRALATLCSGTCSDVAARTGLRAERVALLPAALALLAAAFEVLGGPARLVEGGLREGVVSELARALSGR